MYLLFSIIAIFDGKRLYKKLLKKSLTQDLQGPKRVFEYKGQIYDQDIFVPLRAEMLLSLDLKGLQKKRKELLESMAISRNIEKDRAALEAIDLAISRKQK